MRFNVSEGSLLKFKRHLAYLIHNVLNTPRPEGLNPLRGWLILLVIFFIFSLIFGFVWVSYFYQTSQANHLLQDNTHKIAAHVQKQWLQDIKTAQLLPYSVDHIHTNQQNPSRHLFLVNKIEHLQFERPDLLRVQYWYSNNSINVGCQSTCHLSLNVISKAAPGLVKQFEGLPTLPPFKQTEWFSQPYTMTEPVVIDGKYAVDLWVIQPQGLGHRYIRFTYGLKDVLSLMTKKFELDADTAFLLSNGQVLVENKLFERQSIGQTATSTLKLLGLSLQFQLTDFNSSSSFFSKFLSNTVLYLSALLIFSVLLLCIDVRKRLHVQKMLEQQYALQKAMEESLVTGLRARDFSGITIYVNPAFCRMLGFSIDELVGYTLPMPDWSPEEITAYQTNYERKLLNSAVCLEGFETVLTQKNGTRFPVLIFDAPLLDAKGTQIGWMSSIVDTTNQKKMELIARQQQERLAQQARLATMGELSSTLSHELNQPLAAISSYATATLNMLQSKAFQPNDIQEGLLRIAKQAQRAGLVIRSIHDFVRRKKPVRESLDLRQVVKNIYPLIELQAKHSMTQLTFNTPFILPNVFGDRLMLEQVILNLTRNAIEAMKHLSTAQRRLSIDIQYYPANVHDSKVRFCVSDCGEGITDEVALNIFNPFFSTKEDGMGMGLAICRTVIEAAHGRLWYENIKNGCTFIVELPAHGLDTMHVSEA